MPDPIVRFENIKHVIELSVIYVRNRFDSHLSHPYWSDKQNVPTRTPKWSLKYVEIHVKYEPIQQSRYKTKSEAHICNQVRLIRKLYDTLVKYASVAIESVARPRSAMAGALRIICDIDCRGWNLHNHFRSRRLIRSDKWQKMSNWYKCMFVVRLSLSQRWK